MNPDQAQKLREPFPAEMIGKLPKPTKKDNPKGKCAECGGWHGLPAIHLDYVGHAATTDRLLQVDPEWTWEPAAADESGLPVMLVHGELRGLWIKMTVAGVTRYGFGDGPTIKECISDAIRNAAMRFGVALDLWSKEDLHADSEQGPEPTLAGGSSDAPAPAEDPSVAAIKKAPHTSVEIGQPVASVAQRTHLRTKLNELRTREPDAPLVAWWDGLKPSGQTKLTPTQAQTAIERVLARLAVELEPGASPQPSAEDLAEFDKVAQP